MTPIEDSGTRGATAMAAPTAGAGPNHPPRMGECLTPGSGAAAVTAVSESAAAVVARSAGAISRRVGVREGDPARRGFTLPQPVEFQVGVAYAVNLSLHRRGR